MIIPCSFAVEVELDPCRFANSEGGLPRPPYGLGLEIYDHFERLTALSGFESGNQIVKTESIRDQGAQVDMSVGQ